MTEVYTFDVDAITCHAWNKDKTEVALCPNSNVVHIYRRLGATWKLVEMLNAHDQKVMGIDWAPKTNRIVTCAADKNAYVWSLDKEKKWVPALVYLRTNRAATCVKWSPDENKFAVGSGDKVVSVCCFSTENNWWTSKHIKKPLRSTVTSLDWHPNNKILVAGSTDYKIRVFSAYIENVEDPPGEATWGNVTTFGALLAEFCNSPMGGGWVHAVAFSPCGKKICWVGHNSSVCVADSTKDKDNAVTRLYTEHLPFLSCVWVGPNSIITAGHSCMPMLYSLDDKGQLYFASKLDTTQKKEAAGLSAMLKFQSLDRHARTEINDNLLHSIHQNTITCVRPFNDTSNKTQYSSHCSTSSLDGQLVVWDLKLLENSIAGLKII